MRQCAIFLTLVAAGTAYAWWTQPHVGPASPASALNRSLVIAVWLAVFVLIKTAVHASWSWERFAIGAALGGGWLSLAFSMGETLVDSAVFVSMGLVLGTISGMFATLVPTVGRAALTGIGVLIAQIIVAVTVHAQGWTKYTYGM